MAGRQRRVPGPDQLQSSRVLTAPAAPIRWCVRAYGAGVDPARVPRPSVIGLLHEKGPSNERWKSIHGSEEKITATKNLTNSRIEGWWSVHGSETRTLHQNTTLRKEVTSIAPCHTHQGRIPFRAKHGPEGQNEKRPRKTLKLSRHSFESKDIVIQFVSEITEWKCSDLLLPAILTSMLFLALESLSFAHATSWI